MKKYSSYKNLKPICNPYSKTPMSPTHNSSYKKLGLVDLSIGRPHQKIQVYPSTAKYSTSSNMNVNNYINLSNRKKLLSNKKQYPQTPTIGSQSGNKSPLSLIYRPNQQTPNGYQNIKTKINDLESRLQQIKKNYDASYVRKQSQKSLKLKQKQNNQRVNNNNYANNNTSVKNKENEQPKEKKTQSKLLLERYQQKKLTKNQTASTINLYNGQSINSNKNFEQPLSPTNKIRMQKRQTTQCIQRAIQPQQKLQQKKNIRKIQKQSFNNSNSNQQQSSTYLKEFVTTFTCDNKLSISHSNSETNLFKPSNKLAIYTNVHKYYVSAVLNAFSNQKPTSFDNLCRNHLTTSIDILQYIKNSNKQPPTTIQRRPLPKTHKQTIIFDLDETLIHCNQNLTIQHDVALPIKFPNGSIIKAGINVRPYAKECLKQLAKFFEIIVFTASHECYGNVIVDYLDPNRQFVAHRYFRDSCHKTDQGFYVKDLRVVDRDLKNVLLIDNAAYSYCFQLDNGVPIVPFYDNKADLELKNLISYLKDFLSHKDVRVRNSLQMKLTHYTNFKDAKSLINKLYSLDQNQN